MSLQLLLTLKKPPLPLHDLLEIQIVDEMAENRGTTKHLEHQYENEMTRNEMTRNEMTRNVMTRNVMTRNVMTRNEMTRNEMTRNVMTRNEMTNT